MAPRRPPLRVGPMRPRCWRPRGDCSFRARSGQTERVRIARPAFGNALRAISGSRGAADDRAMDLTRHQPRAGRHADRWFRETYRPWRRKARLAFAAVAPAMGGVIMALALVWPTWWRFFAACTVGALCALYPCLIDSPPEWIERKRRGRDGERRTEKRLRALERRGWSVVHNVQHAHGDLDHLVVGPAGVFLLETKNSLARRWSPTRNSSSGAAVSSATAGLLPGRRTIA